MADFRDSGYSKFQEPDFRFQMFQIPDSRFQVPGSKFQVPDSKVRDSKIPDPNSRFRNSKDSRLGIPNRVAIASSRYHLR
ncbi:MAG: hypothetical protein IPN69_13030 [Acidobacteria bacterium]|nr:hypothetical protein [Acidobacteriota bacterium]MBK8149000.1 hypothetical protein [Acidobacteriota bacterium]MBK8811642.1 hypothetical protein [Acidobacteriota bacterium]